MCFCLVSSTIMSIVSVTGTFEKREHSFFKIISSKQCFTYLKRLLSSEQVKQLDRLLTLRYRLVRWNCGKDFLEKCLTHGISTQKLRKTIRANKQESTVGVCNGLLRVELTSETETLVSMKDEVVSLLPHTDASSSLLRFLSLHEDDKCCD